MSDRFRKAFRALLVCRDGSTRSETRLCMTGYNTANNFDTRVTRSVADMSSVAIAPYKNEIKRNDHVGSGSSLRRAAAEAAAKKQSNYGFYPFIFKLHDTKS